jgi:hypothetical protein
MVPSHRKKVSIRQTIVGVEQWPGKITLDEEAISEILVADIDTVSGAETSDVDDFEEEEQQ